MPSVCLLMCFIIYNLSINVLFLDSGLIMVNIIFFISFFFVCFFCNFLGDVIDYNLITYCFELLIKLVCVSFHDITNNVIIYPSKRIHAHFGRGNPYSRKQVTFSFKQIDKFVLKIFNSSD